MSTKHETLTPRQRKVLDVYRAEHAAEHRAPTLREVGRALGRSAPTVLEHVHKLVAIGVLRPAKHGRLHRAVLTDVCPLCNRKLDTT